LSLHK